MEIDLHRGIADLLPAPTEAVSKRTFEKCSRFNKMINQVPRKDSPISFILDQLSDMPSLQAKRMFGGVGFFQKGKMFGMLNNRGTFLLKVDRDNRNDYLRNGMFPLSKDKNTRRSTPFYAVPQELLESRKDLSHWAQKSLKIAHKRTTNKL